MVSSRSTSQRGTSVVVESPARLHMGFIDLHGGCGRTFGSLGLALARPSVEIEVAAARELQVLGHGGERVSAWVRQLGEAFRWPIATRIDIRRTIPEHVGLGSGTQLALAVGAALARLYGAQVDARAIARAFARGARSGIGIGVFEQGGFVVDGGRGRKDEPPPLIAHLPFPERWRVLLVLDRRAQGLHGQVESAAFAALSPFPERTAARLARVCLMQILPAVAEHDLASFGAGVTELQREIGDYFAAAQGGRFTSQEVSRALAWLSARGATAVGQSSWGPTGFCVVESQEAADALAREARRRFVECTCLEFVSLAARNDGSRIEVSAASPQQPMERGRLSA